MLSLHTKCKHALLAVASLAVILPTISLVAGNILSSGNTYADVTTIPEGQPFTDINFYNCVVGWIGVDNVAETGPTTEQLESITHLTCNGSGKPDSEKIQNVTGIDKMTALTDITLDYNQLTSIDLSRNTKLEFLSVHNNELQSLDLSNNTALIQLHSDNNQLTSINLPENSVLNLLWLQMNKLASIDLSKNSALNSVHLNYNQLTSIKMANNTALETLELYKNQLSSITLSQAPNLKQVNLNDNQLTSIDVSGNTELKKLYLNDNNLTSINVSNNVALTNLGLGGNYLTSIDVSNNINLIGLTLGLIGSGEMHHNTLNHLDVSKNTKLELLIADYIGIDSIDLSKNTALTTLYLHYNNISSIDLSNNTELIKLYMGDNKLESSASLVGTFEKLKELNLRNNQIAYFDGSNFPNLEYLHVGLNPLVFVDISKNKHLGEGFSSGFYLSYTGNEGKEPYLLLDRIPEKINNVYNYDLTRIKSDAHFAAESSNYVFDKANNALAVSYMMGTGGYITMYDSSDITNHNTNKFYLLLYFPLSYDLMGGSGTFGTQICYPNDTFGGCDVTISVVSPLREGHHFLGWANSNNATKAAYQPGESVSLPGSQTPAIDRTLYAVWAPIYTLTYNNNGGSDSINSQTCYPNSTNGSCKISIPNTTLEREDYRFLGWADTADAKTAKYRPGDNVSLSANKTLYAVWTQGASYTISYDPNDGTGNSMMQICDAEDGQSTCSAPVLDINPTRDNYVFLGWADAKNATTATYHAGDTITVSADKTIYAIWAPIYTLTFDNNGGSGNIGSQTCNPNSTNGSCEVTIPTNIPSRESYHFLGWSSKTSTTGPHKPGDTITLNTSKTAYAIWAPVFTLTYDNNGGSGNIGSQTCHPESTDGSCDITVSSTTPTRTNYTFLGWADSSDAVTAAYHAGDTITLSANKTIYAVWEEKTTPDPTPDDPDNPTPDPEPIIYTLSFNLNGGTSNISITNKTCEVTTEGDSCIVVIPTIVPTKTNNNFLGWNENSSATAGTYYPGQSILINKNTTLYAIWEEKTTPDPTPDDPDDPTPDDPDDPTPDDPTPDDPDDPTPDEGTGTVTWIENQSYTIGSGKNMILKIDYALDDFLSLAIDKQTVTKDKYLLTSGSTVITILGDYLDTLTEGQHTLTANFTNDRAVSATFEITKSTTPDPTPTPDPDSTTNPDDENIKVPDTGMNTNNGLSIISVLSILTILALSTAGIIIRKKNHDKGHYIFDK